MPRVLPGTMARRELKVHRVYRDPKARPFRSREHGLVKRHTLSAAPSFSMAQATSHLLAGISGINRTPMVAFIGPCWRNKEEPVRPVRKVLPAMMARKVHRVSQARKVFRVIRALKVNRDKTVHLAHKGFQDLQVRTATTAPPVLRVHRDHKARRVSPSAVPGAGWLSIPHQIAFRSRAPVTLPCKQTQASSRTPMLQAAAATGRFLRSAVLSQFSSRITISQVLILWRALHPLS